MKQLSIFLMMLIFFFSLSSLPSLKGQEKKEEKKIKEFEQTIEEEKKDAPHKEKAQHADDDNEEPSIWNKLFFEMLVKPVFVWTFIGPPGENTLLDHNSFWNRHYTPYPYVQQDVGIYSESSTKSSAISLTGNYFRHDSELQGFGLSGKFAFLPFLALDVKYTHLIEQLESGKDNLHFYDIILNYSRFRTGQFALWWGIGLKGMKGDNHHNGMSFNVGTEIYPFKPVSLHLNYNMASINELFVRLNYHQNRYIIYTGYQRYSAGDAVLDGVLAGVGVYF